MIGLIRRIYNYLLNQGNFAFSTVPTSADTVANAAVTLTAGAAWTWGAWAQVAASVGTADVLVWAFSLESPVRGTLTVAGTNAGEVELGTGGGGAEVAFFRSGDHQGFNRFPTGYYIAAATRAASRYRTSIAASTIGVKWYVITGF